ncbi:adenylate/guanylate cyclase domain-containing protein [Flavihumibacter solisilvae]|uniref:Guanylate cyclase n=1 Tax=Flavihumibacter solisilvae TaxID=1349421 RepID=A0A0C1L7P7_9BACT|nr:adenylate/guanylate cyclase domain-containing protein [Flavihumibacter solisilvae]KIC95571.1 guanylate cyclase [Flavihumibacter solisilvae]
MRQLAAILFADMTGYTTLVQENEQLARQKRRRLKTVLESCINSHNGKILQYYGDGSLSIFNSAIDSVRCSINIQQQLMQEPKVDLRIGIHTGDIIIDEDAVYGDGVNLASRIESLAVPGGILISEKVYDEIRNQENIIASELGYFELKNVRSPVRIYAISNNGIVVPTRQDLKGKTKQTGNRLAVLPFVNMSADPENEYFSDGITEELLNALTRVEGLQVTSRTSAFAFKGTNHDIRDIAIQLNVDKVLEGSVRKAGNRVRITAQLINAADGYHIWSENYDRNLTDIFEVQDEISARIANKMRENLSTPVREEHLVKVPVKNVTAYTYYLKGLHFWNKLTPADTRKAIEYFEQAIALEPGYAHAYAMIAAAYSFLGATGQMLPSTAFEIVHRFADKALELDDSIAESHIAKASAYLFYEWNWPKGYEALQKAMSLNRGAIEAYELMGFYYVIKGQKEEAVNILEEAERIDPLSPIVLQTLGNMYMFAGRYDDSIRQAEKLLEIDPQMRIAIEIKGWGTGMKGDWHAAKKLFQEVHRLTGHPLKGLMGLAFSHGRLGEKEEALECIRKMEQRQLQEPDSVIDADIAAAWFGLGDMDKTFEYLNRCIDKRMGPVSYFLEYPAYQGVKEDPRYAQLMERTQRTIPT